MCRGRAFTSLDLGRQDSEELQVAAKSKIGRRFVSIISLGKGGLIERVLLSTDR